eukprot:TRINITY_DN9269_c0_g1_i1.p1 TRINITY_DN9269_c0_g1~~TRINITY_DN9269_c0_g1_i1.p1  ORF type:complete len:298 (-),score=191.95 TRINITY_DN9269_c0_g1_i1:84-977(-)
MGFVKIVKNKAYFKRFQVKYRRRREGKTDYQARRRLITQDKNKYNSPKYRFVVRFTNKDVVTQIIYSKISGDVVMTAAYSHELPKYGITCGLTNYAAAYATGLLLARRHLTKLGLASKYIGKETADGENFIVEPVENGPRPFLALLDVGLVRTTTGSRVFSALKGAVDGGLNIPHSESRFFGFNKETKKLDAKKLRKNIFGGHVTEYMKILSQANPERYKKQFSRYIKAGIFPDNIENLYKEAHKAIRANPAFKKSDKKKPEVHSSLKFKRNKLPRNQKLARIQTKIALKTKREESA